MKALFLGTGEAFSKKPNTSILIDEKILLDCGFTTLQQLRKAEKKLEKIEAIFLSHFHADHSFALPAFLTASLEEGRETPLTIYSHSGIEEYTKRLLRLAYGKKLSDLGFKVNFRPVKPNQKYSFKQYQFSFAPLHHSAPSFAISVEKKNSQNKNSNMNREQRSAQKITYLADGFPSEEAEALSKDSNLLIAEAYKGGTETHSSALKAAHVAHDFNCKKLALVHIYRETKINVEKIEDVFHEFIIPDDLQLLDLNKL